MYFLVLNVTLLMRRIKSSVTSLIVKNRLIIKCITQKVLSNFSYFVTDTQNFSIAQIQHTSQRCNSPGGVGAWH